MTHTSSGVYNPLTQVFTTYDGAQYYVSKDNYDPSADKFVRNYVQQGVRSGSEYQTDFGIYGSPVVYATGEPLYFTNPSFADKIWDSRIQSGMQNRSFLSEPSSRYSSKYFLGATRTQSGMPNRSFLSEPSSRYSSKYFLGNTSQVHQPSSGLKSFLSNSQGTRNSLYHKTDLYRGSTTNQSSGEPLFFTNATLINKIWGAKSDNGIISNTVAGNNMYGY